MSEDNVHFFEFGEFTLDVANFRLLEQGEQVQLTQKSFELLQFLIENRARVLKKEELLEALWEGNYVEEANLTQHIYMLRKALRQRSGERVFIETIPKTGYRFIAPVNEIPSNPAEDPAPDSIEPEDQSPYQPEPEVPSVKPNMTSPSLLRPERRRSGLIAVGGVIGVCALLIAAVVYFTGAGQNNEVEDGGSIAVLPFKQISGEKDEKLGLGIADVIIAKLANIGNIAVRPTTSIIRYADEDKSDLFEVGKALNVDYVIEGSIQRDDGKVRVTTQLYSVDEKKQVWTETFDEEYSDIFSLQDSISERIAQKVALEFRAGEKSFPFKQYTENPEAYQAFTTGLSYWSQQSKVGFQSSIVHFQKAIEKDPHFALAYAYLADTYAHYGYLKDLLDREQALRRGEEMANKALKLDPDCAEALAAKALVYAARNRGTEAFELMKRSLQIKPNDANAHHRIAWMYANRGDLDSAIKEMKIAVDLDPQSTFLNLYLARFYYLARKPEEAEKYCDRTLKIDPDAGEAKWRRFEVLELEGKLDQVEKSLKEALPRNTSNPAVKLFLARVMAEKGDDVASSKMLETAERSKVIGKYDFFLALAHIAQGRRDEAIEELEEAVRENRVELFVLRSDPNLDPIRSDPRFKSLVRDMEISGGWVPGGGS